MSRSVKTLAWAVGAASALAAGAAQARSDVYWSIDIVAPGYPVGVGASVSNAPRVVYPAPVVVAPPPVVYAPPPVVYVPRPVYVASPPVWYAPPGHGWGKKHWKRVHGPAYPYHHDHRPGRRD